MRSWERRYGLAPSLHTAGGHRRYGPVDLARLEVMHRLVQQGVPPAEAARAAIEAEIGADAREAAKYINELQERDQIWSEQRDGKPVFRAC